MMKTQRLLVLQLRRERMGEIQLPEDLQPGEWREIHPEG